MANAGFQFLSSLLVCVVVLSEPATTLKCVCNDTLQGPTVSCIVNDFTCESTTMCYVQQFWSMSLGRAVSMWGCLDRLPNHFPGPACTINHADNVYFCCNNTDYCNNVTLQLPREMSVTTTETVTEGDLRSASTSPSTSTEGTFPSTDEGTVDSNPCWPYYLVLTSVAILVIVLFSVVIVILIHRIKRLEDKQSHLEQRSTDLEMCSPHALVLTADSNT